MAAFDVGFRSTVTPIPPVWEHTELFPAGALVIALEHRELNAEIIRGSFTDGSQDMISIETVQAVDAFDDEGPSIHVFDSATNREYLRFDMFVGDPHYHYIRPGVDSLVVVFDRAANGPMWDWVVRCLRERLTDMLVFGGAGELARKVHRPDVESAVEQVLTTASARGLHPR